MPDDSRYRMSREHLEELKEKLEYLQTVREKEVSEQIREARSFGDLSENSEYDEAKTEQGRLYSQIADLRDLIENAVIIEVTRTGSRGVVMGSRVTVREQSDTETETYEIVGSQEADPMAGRISDESPLGRSRTARGDTFHAARAGRAKHVAGRLDECPPVCAVRERDMRWRCARERRRNT